MMLAFEGLTALRSPLEVMTYCCLQILYCTGPAIDALLATGAHHYLEFKLISGESQGPVHTRALEVSTMILARLAQPHLADQTI